MWEDLSFATSLLLILFAYCRWPSALDTTMTQMRIFMLDVFQITSVDCWQVQYMYMKQCDIQHYCIIIIRVCLSMTKHVMCHFILPTCLRCFRWLFLWYLPGLCILLWVVFWSGFQHMSLPARLTKIQLSNSQLLSLALFILVCLWTCCICFKRL